MSFAGNKEKNIWQQKKIFPTKHLSKIECLNTKTSGGSPAKQCTAPREDYNKKKVLNYFPTQSVNKQKEPIIEMIQLCL